MKLFCDSGGSLEDGSFSKQTEVISGECESAGDEVEAVVAESCPLCLPVEVPSLVKDHPKQFASPTLLHP